MKKNINICSRFSYLAALFVVTTFASCVRVELEDPSFEYGAEISFGISKGNGFSKLETKTISESVNETIVDYDANDPSSLGLNISQVDGIESVVCNSLITKGIQVNSINEFDVAAYYHVNTNSTAKLYFKDKVSDGVHTSDNSYYWPTIGLMNFVATYPSNLISGGIDKIANENGQLQSFVYNISDDVKSQQDIMVAITNNVDNSEKCKNGSPVNLNFNHLLAAVKFQVGDMQFIKINSITLADERTQPQVKSGEVKFTYNNGAWVPSFTANSKALSYNFTLSSNMLADTEGLPKGSDITGNEFSSTLFVVPQDASGLTVRVNYTELLTGTNKNATATLPNNTSWVAGKTSVYALNIGTKFEVTIPTPPDQDAHYILFRMEYKLGALSSYITDIQATAQWKDPSITSKITLKFDDKLTPTQKKGFWTDKLIYEEIGSDGKTKLKEDRGSILGEQTLPIDNTTGFINLFIEENSGDESRMGELIFSALPKGRTERIILGRGEFTQLCPSWNGTNESSLGVERFEDKSEDNNEMLYPYGFLYNRKVTYTNNTTGLLSIPFLGDLVALYYGSVISGKIEDDEGGFITVTPGKTSFGVEYVSSVVLDYSALSLLDDIATTDSGYTNTLGLYNFTGGNNISEMEELLDGISFLTKGKPSGDENTPSNYAAYTALSRNRMFEHEIKVDGVSSLEDAVSHRAELYEDANGNEIVDWFLPSIVEAKSLVEIGLSNASTQTSPLQGTYWSSTAIKGNSVSAMSYTWNGNSFRTTEEGRLTDLKVRAVRRRP